MSGDLVSLERAMVGVLASGGDVAAASHVQPADFDDLRLGRLFSAITSTADAGEPVMIDTVAPRLSQSGDRDELINVSVEGRYAARNSGEVARLARLVVDGAGVRAGRAVGHSLLVGELTASDAIGRLAYIESRCSDREPAGAREAGPGPLRAPDLMRLAAPEVERLVGPLVVRGYRTVVGGGTGAGKTRFCMQLAAAAVNGVEFLGYKGAGGLTLLVLDLEQGVSTAKKRLAEVGLADSDRTHYWRHPGGLLITDPEIANEVEAVIAEINPDIVLVDPLYKLHGGDPNSEQDMKPTFLLLDRWREKYGFAIVLVTHARKGADDHGVLTTNDIAAGSTVIIRGAEIIMGIVFSEPGKSKLYFFKDRDNGAEEVPVHGAPWTLSFSAADGFQRVEREAFVSRKAPAEAIAQFIRERGGNASPKEIRDRFGIADATLRDARDPLAALGIKYVKNGRDSHYIDPAARAPQSLRDPGSAGNEPQETTGTDAAPRNPAASDGAGQQSQETSGFAVTPHPALPYGEGPAAAGSPREASNNHPPKPAEAQSADISGDDLERFFDETLGHDA